MANPNVDILEMSDEDFLNADPATFTQPAADETSTTTNTDQAADEGSTDNSGDGSTNLEDTSPPPDDDDDEKLNGGDPNEDSTSTNKAEKTDKTADPAEADKTPKPDTTEVTDAQYAEIGRQIMSEFKANGTTIKVKSVDDALQLMQMGANYHKKMAGLKPSLKTLKLLENNDLLDPDKLSYLIDLSQKKPEAITQLLKDSKIDPMNIDMTAETSYVPPQRSVSDTEILLDEVLDSISHSPSYNRTLNVLGDEWDSDSRSLIAKTPEIIRTINAHMESGIYDQVAKAIEYERSLGKLSGVSDFEAYQRVGTYMHENNMFVSAAAQTTPPAKQNTQPTDSQAASKTAADADREARKKAASPSRSGKTAADSKADYNPLTMSDEDFIKFNKLHI